jgi:glucosamine--fructose-6-phosphate aminotransferase (isomerizing)
MCGIVGYTGAADAVPFLLEGLSRLEYRGYDSAGIAVVRNGRLEWRKAVGNVSALAAEVRANPLQGSPGISHTRWATHGEVTMENAHPHFDASGRLALVHNGVVENHRELRAELEERGHRFVSKTDSEVLARLIGDAFDGGDGDSLRDAVASSLSRAKGSFAVGVVHADAGGAMVAARRGSPLVAGFGDSGHFIASDPGALSGWVGEVVYLDDGEAALLDGKEFRVSRISPVNTTVSVASATPRAPVEPGLGGFSHFMEKEIHEQPESLREAMRGRLDVEEGTARLAGFGCAPEAIRAWDELILASCGSSFHAALAGEYIIESLARIPVECEYAGEFRYRNSPMEGGAAVFALSQSGETADTLAAVRESRRRGFPVFGITNNTRSSLARETAGGIDLRAGPEIGVAATKTFTSQVTILCMLGLMLGRMRDMERKEGEVVLKALSGLPDLVAATLQTGEAVRAIAEKYAHSQSFLFFGRQAHFPVALEGALKLKEVSYISTCAHPSAELKHGVIALVNESTPSVFIAPRDGLFEKNLGNIEEVRARRGPVIAIGTEGDTELGSICDDVILVPDAPPFLAPILTVVPLQLLAYHIAVLLGCDVDKPRNLAKSVTVE